MKNECVISQKYLSIQLKNVKYHQLQEKYFYVYIYYYYYKNENSNRR